MFRFIKKIFFIGLTTLSGSTSVNSLSCISMSNQECKVRPQIINAHSNNPVFYPFSIKASKCSCNCNNVNDSYAKICVTGVVKDIKVKVLNLMSRNNETRHIKRHGTCKCMCILDVIVCNNKQRWKEDKCRCEGKELTDKGVCDKGYAWKHSNCECEFDKSCDVGEYLDYENCKCGKRLIDRLVDECDENIDEEVKMVSESNNKCNSCIFYIVLFSIFFIINVGIGTYFVYYKYMNRNKQNLFVYECVYQAKNH